MIEARYLLRIDIASRIISHGYGLRHDFLHSDRSYDILLCVTLDDEAALDKYQADDYHCNVVKPYVQSHRRSYGYVG